MITTTNENSDESQQVHTHIYKYINIYIYIYIRENNVAINPPKHKGMTTVKRGEPPQPQSLSAVVIVNRLPSLHLCFIPSFLFTFFFLFRLSLSSSLFALAP
ncbi:hypothetical protein, unlikely [Trypanosoma brucei gambiense DAL972]|uniref:Uncharacterized protein n=1 Tax=Trypanosoma brucei gambiense (strain MHOM/CI/86/DAL972) TaxID=679716 RepID=C9ZKK8_TRYB9|nr:hypothetical protein, unlikely [Trypanosoma brucei gambiense DAL972]CBH09974.1 hypothetical protein, unlikely [Trypanosoma brucei gambiense DAL972]|eukprot:XP_011772265.1 hypothetical protein, unlikely [Trypanosoma brucei gambiense DAL972]